MPISRTKSCQHCRRAKARCNLAANCSRCIDRGLQCTYTPFSITSHTNDKVFEPSEVTGVAGTIDNGDAGMSDFQLTGNGSEAMTDDIIEWPGSEWSGTNVLPSLARGTAITPISFRDMIDEAQDAILLPNDVSPLELGFSTAPSADKGDGVIVLYGTVFHNILCLKPQSSLTGRLLWGQLKSYPFLLTHGQLPPFIYPSCVLNDQLPKNCVVRGVHQCVHEPLAICASLVGMFEARTPTNNTSVWRTIHSEIHRLQSTFHTYSSDDLLATFQALMIYLLLQTQDPGCRSQKDIGFLIVTIVEVSSSLEQLQGQTFCRGLFTEPSFTQSEWIFNESIRRSVHVFYLIDSVLYEEIISSTDPRGCGGFDMVPLCGPRMLWDYHSNETWAWRLETFKSRGYGPQLTIQDLRAAGRGETVEGMEGWCESVDEFGGLLWMTTLLS